MVIGLLVSDIDGTLVTKDKHLTDGAIDAAARLAKAGVALALTSSRPPHGIEVFARALHLTNSPRRLQRRRHHRSRRRPSWRRITWMPPPRAKHWNI